MTEVDFVVNCFERNYRRVLTPGFLSRLIDEQRFPFTLRTALVNNTDNATDAQRQADRLVATGEIDRWLTVADALPHAMEATRHPRLRTLAHWTDFALVAVTLPGPDWLVYWDPDAHLREPCDWVGPTLELMQADARIAVGNPNNWHDGLAEREALSVSPPFALGYGFSDVAFLSRRSDLGRPIYRKVAPAAWRYPLAHVEPIFEQRVDAWMRRANRLRATYLPAVCDHPDAAGANYPSSSRLHALRRRALNLTARNASRLTAHPAVRAWPKRQ